MKKMKIQEFNQDYIMINEKDMFFEEEYPGKEQFDYISDKAYHLDIKEYVIKYMHTLSNIRMGEIGKYRMDGVPFGFNAFIITIEMEEK